MTATTLDFSPARWDRVRDAHDRWWAGTLDRPLIQVYLHGRETGRPPSSQPCHYVTSFYDDAVPADEIVDAWDFQLSGQKFLGDAFPHVHPNYGPGVLAAFLGARLVNGAETAWFHPESVEELADLHLAFDPSNCWVRRLADIAAAAERRWNGNVQVDMTDLGGCLDVVSSFRPSESLLFDLLDHPDEVKRVVGDVHRCWGEAFAALNAPLKAFNPGHSAWCHVFSSDPYYILQSDFSYMIGPDMFEEFVKDELTQSCREIKNTLYHLDGPGQLPHLDHVLSIPELGGVQWVPGAGQRGMGEWPEVYRKIHAAGKKIQIYGAHELDAVAQQIGTARGTVTIVHAGIEEESAMRSWLESHGVAP